MIDERNNKPSASSVHRYAVCPGSFALEQTVPAPPASPDATLGTRVHAWLEGDLITLTDEEQELADRCAEQEHQLVRDTFGVPSELLHPVREQRLWEINTAAWSGKADAIYVREGHALVLDYKTGRGDVEAATGNLQLRALAVLVFRTYPSVTSVMVAIIQPLASRTPSVCRYETEHLNVASNEIDAIMLATGDADAPRRATPEGCKYCRAKGFCPEAQTVVETLPAAIQRDGREIVMSGDQVAQFLEAAQVAEGVIEAVRAKAKRMLEESETAVPGWRLKAGAVREKIVDANTVFGRFLNAGGTEQQFMPCVTVSKGGLKTALKTALGAKGKALDEKLDCLLDGCTESTQAAPSLVKEDSQ